MKAKHLAAPSLSYLTMMEEIDKANRFSYEKVCELRSEIALLGLPRTLSVVTTGSFGRREAHELSDIDYYILVDNRGMVISQDYIYSVKDTIDGIVRRVGKRPSEGGAFGGFESIEEMLINIGGSKDDNDKITRRILLLLEGDWLFNEELFIKTRRRLLHRYIGNSIKKENIARFLLNDIIRYYRTICVDFEYKTFEARKDWGTRNIKLVYSRKMLYISGIVCVAETADQEDKISVVENLIKEPPDPKG